MTKNTAGIEKVLKGGTPKQRALLLANHIADVNLGGKGLLSESEVQALSDSFRKESEIEVYNRYRRIFDKVQVYLTNLSQFRLSYMNALSRLENLIIIRQNNADMEDLSNQLIQLMPNKKTREKAIKVVKGFSDPSVFRPITTDKEGFIQILRKDTLLDELIESSRKRVEQEQADLKTAIQVIKDYFEENNFKVKVFQGFVRIVENWAKAKHDKGLSVVLNSRSIKALMDPRLRELAKKHLIEPDYDSVPIDSDKYSALKQSYLDA